MKLWKLLLISLRVLMTMHLLRSKIRILTQQCFQLFEYYIFYFLIVFPSPSLYVTVPDMLSVNRNHVVGGDYALMFRYGVMMAEYWK